MKKTCLLILAALATVVLTGCNEAEPDNSALEAARKDAGAVSNQLIETSMKLNHVEQMVQVLELNATNLHQTIAQFSNQVVTLRAHLADNQKQLIAAQAEAPKRDLRILELDTKLTEQAAQIARLTALAAEGGTRAAPLEKHITALEAERTRLQAENERLKFERSELLRLWDDPLALNQRLLEVEPKQIKKTSPKVTKNTRLALMPEGGVKVSEPPAATRPAAEPKKSSASSKPSSSKPAGEKKN